MHILGFIFIIFIVIFVSGISLIGSIIRALFGFKRRGPQQRSYSSGNGTNQQQGESQKGGYTHRSGSSTITIFDTNVKPKKKIFTEDEGEYTDYEVVV